MFSCVWQVISALCMFMTMSYVGSRIPEDVNTNDQKALMASVKGTLDQLSDLQKPVFVVMFCIGMLPVGVILCLIEAAFGFMGGAAS